MDRNTDKRSANGTADLIAVAIAMVITAAAYVRSLANGFVFDDRALVVGNRYISEWSFIWTSFVNDVWWFGDPSHLPQSAYYRPLENLWLALNYHLFGLNPIGWHATMIAVHLVAVWLVFQLARELTQNPIAAFVAALLFGLIPIHAGTISWARSIPLPASAAFQIGALLCFIRRAYAPRRKLATALTLFAAALLSHESPVIFPVIVAAYVFLLEAPEQERLLPNFTATIERVKRSAIEAAPFIVVVIAYLALRLWVLGAIAPVSPRNDWTTAERMLTVPEALARFLLLLLMPWRAGPGHEMQPADSVLVSAFYLPALGLAATGAALWLLFRRHPHRGLYLFCAVWIVIALAPVLNLRTLDPVETIQDRFLYMPSAPWCVFLGDFAAGFIAVGGVRARIVAPAAAALALVYGAYLWRAEHFWHDELTYFGRCVQSYPDSWVCRTNLGMELWHTGDLNGAERELESATRIRPHDGVIVGDLASVHVKMGKLDRAKEEFAREIDVWKDAPVAAYVELAEVSAQLGDRTTSEQMLTRAASMPGGQLAAAVARAKIKIHVDRDYTGAETVLMQIPPAQRDVDTWLLLASIARKQGRLQDTLEDYDSALRLAPSRVDLHVRRAGTLDKLGRHHEALLETESTLSLDPDNPELRALVDRLQKLSKPQSARWRTGNQRITWAHGPPADQPRMQRSCYRDSDRACTA